jgi:hypothetical protein
MRRPKTSSSVKRWIVVGLQLILIWIVIVSMISFAFADSITAAEQATPFHPGEELVFEVKWKFIPAGEAVLKVLQVKKINGVEHYHFLMTAKTYNYIDPLYKVRDRIDAYTDVQMTYSRLYKQKNRGRRKKDIVLNFDLERQQVQYTKNGKKRKPISILPGSFDPLSVFYAFRFFDLKENMVLEVPVTDGKKCVIGKGTVIKRETIRLKNGTYDTYLVEPDLKHIGGVFRKSKNAKLRIWVTADERRIPVKIESEVIVGSFVAELVSAKGIAQDVFASEP